MLIDRANVYSVCFLSFYINIPYIYKTMGSALQNKSCSTRRTVLRKSKRGKFNHCKDCGFKSKRAFNLVRHYERIHEPAKRVLKCCGKRYLTKGQFYQHCANVHPESRRSSIVSTTIYKIRTTVKKEEPKRRRSLRLVVKSEKKIEVKNRGFYFDENIPLINYVKNREFDIKKEEKVEIKTEEFHHQRYLDVNNSIQIFSKGDFTSPIHRKIQQEFLSDINFEDFKIF